MDKYEKGSEWRKWDLHVHTPYTKLNDNYHIDNEQKKLDYFCEKIEQSNVSVFGVTDYFSISNFCSFKDNFNEKHPSSEKVFFPNVEFRLDSKNAKEEHIQLHIIFDNRDNTLNKIEAFLTRLKLVSTNDSNLTNKYCTDKDLKNVGFDKAMVKLDDLTVALENDFSKHEYLIVGVANGYGSVRPGKKDGRGAEYAKELDKVCDLFFGNSSNTDFYLNKVKGRDQYQLPPKPVLNGCDAHSLEDLENKLGKEYKKTDDEGNVSDCSEITWIKADPTFEGLKQIIYEPEDRVYIGKNPPILDKVESNRTKYIKSLKIDQENQNHTGDTWFEDIVINFNKELVAIIGNKGSGKSSLADILGLVGDTHIDKKHFSFLHKDKFLKKGLADKFKSQITWESDGISEEVFLGANLQTEKPESVRFIPQNYFEELTNEIEVSKFQEVLEKIIFEHIPDSERLGKSDFDELKKYKTENANTKIQEIQNRIEVINGEIITLEEKKHPKYLQEIEKFIEEKKREIDDQKNLLDGLPNISNPRTNNENSEDQNRLIQQYEKNIECNKNLLQGKELEKTCITSKIEELKQFKERVKHQEQLFNEFVQNNSEKAIKYGLDINKLLEVKIDYSSISNLISEDEEKLNSMEAYFESVESVKKRGGQSDNKSIVYEINKWTTKLSSEMDKLTGEERKFQENQKKKKEIGDRINELTGNEYFPLKPSLKFYQKEETFIKSTLPEQLDKKKQERIDKSLEIFKTKQSIVELYDAFKKAVDNKIEQNKGLLQNYDMKIDSSFKLNINFYNDFLNHINQRKSGCFSGIEQGKDKIKSIIEEDGFNNEEEVSKLLKAILNSLEEGGRIISDQINDEKMSNFYNYVFALDYIQPEYELKLGGKALKQLSPGERGALLLIFYLMIDKEEIPLVIDQPEDNLDNESVYNMLGQFIKKAKRKRQIIMVTHNPNLAVGADAEQVVCVKIDKANKNKFSFTSGSIENPEINGKIVQILEGTKPAFDKRKLKYQTNNQ